jgi:hypothetical protein
MQTPVDQATLLQRNETRRVRGTDTGTTVLDWLAAQIVSKTFSISWVEGNVLGDGELGEVVANHLGLDLDRVELLAGVDADDGADHLGDDDHVAEVGLDGVGLLVGLGLLLGLAQLLDEAHGLALQAAVEPTTGAGVDDIAELLGGEIEKPVMVSDRVQEHCCAPIMSEVAGVPVLTRQGRCRGKRTCGRLSFSSALFKVSYQPVSFFQRPFCGPSTGFYPCAASSKERFRRGGGHRIPAASSAFWKMSILRWVEGMIEFPAHFYSARH